MILHTDTAPTYSSQTMEKQEFKIAASAKAFKILSSNLYRNKIRAIIRELSTNAFDAHISAGHPEKPFEIHLPTDLDPMFWIRDFGIGMSHEQVMSLYTTYFESTKAESNDFVGALGLGSKSPFSYVDSFTVTSFYNGEMRVYDMSLSGGVPNVSVLYEDETDEPNGLKIAVSVRNEDMLRFSQEAKFVYATFTTKPILHSRKTILEDMQIKDIHSEDGYYYGNAAHLGCQNGIYAVMGQIMYPLWPNSSHVQFPEILVRMAGQKSVFLDFELGELDITPSREELSFDDNTVKVITERVDNIGKVLIDDIMKRHQHHVEPRAAWKDINSEPSFIVNLLRDRIVIGGKSLNKWNSHFRWSSMVDGVRNKYRRVYVNSQGEIQSTETRGTRGWNESNLACITRKSIIIVHNDDGKTIQQSLRAIIWKNGFNSTELFLFDTKDRPGARKALEELLELWGDQATVFVNSSEDVKNLRKEYLKVHPAVKAESRGATINSSELVISGDKVYENKKKFFAADIDEFDGHYLLRFESDFVDDKGNFAASYDTVKKAMVALGIDNVMVLRKPQWERIKKNKSATPLVDVMREAVEKCSPVVIARRGAPKFHEPYWVKSLITYYPEATCILENSGLGTNKRKQHYMYQFMHQLEQDYTFRHSLSEDGKKKWDIFNGRRKAIIMARDKKIDEFERKHPLLRWVTNNVGYHSLIAYREEILKLIS